LLKASVADPHQADEPNPLLSKVVTELLGPTSFPSNCGYTLQPMCRTMKRRLEAEAEPAESASLLASHIPMAIHPLSGETFASAQERPPLVKFNHLRVSVPTNGASVK
jgi:hypothetical protein